MSLVEFLHHTEKYLQIQVDDRWYRIPFYVIEDLGSELYTEFLEKKFIEKVRDPPKQYEAYRVWLAKAQVRDVPSTVLVDEARQFIAPQISQLKAYQIFNQL